MKIRHVVRGRCNPDNADGIIRITYYLAHAQRRLGHDVAVYGLESRSVETEVIDRNGLPVYAYPQTRHPFAVHDALVGRLDGPDSDVDIVHIQVPHDPHMYRLSRHLQQRGIAYVVSPHAMWERGALSRHRVRKSVYKWFFDNRMNRNAAGIHSTGTNEIETIRRYAPGVPTFIVRNAIELSEYESVPIRSNWLSHRFNLAEGTRRFVYLGRLDPYQKGLDVLLKAWSIAMADRIDAHLFMIGPSWRGGMTQLREMARELRVSDRVTLTGPLFGSDKVQALQSSDCYIQLSRYETSPYAVLEAFASGLPAILTEETSLATVAEQYGAGWLALLDPEEAAKTIVEVMGSSIEHLREAGQNARRLVEERHSIDRAASKIVEAYLASQTGKTFEDDD